MPPRGDRGRTRPRTGHQPHRQEGTRQPRAGPARASPAPRGRRDPAIARPPVLPSQRLPRDRPGRLPAAPAAHPRTHRAPADLRPSHRADRRAPRAHPGQHQPRTNRAPHPADAQQHHPRPAARRTQRPPKRLAVNAKVPPTCRNCGAPLAESRRQLCPACWPVSRAAIATEASRDRAAKLAQLRREGADPSNTAEARAQRSHTLSARKREQLAWEATQPATTELTAVEFAERVLPTLRDIPLSAIRAATGLSLSACSRIRSGSLTPHERHWTALHDLVGPATPT